jgi:hypothetical protein
MQLNTTSPILIVMSIERKKLDLTKDGTPGMFTVECATTFAVAGAVAKGPKGALFFGALGLLLGYLVETYI